MMQFWGIFLRLNCFMMAQEAATVGSFFLYHNIVYLLYLFILEFFKVRIFRPWAEDSQYIIWQYWTRLKEEEKYSLRGLTVNGLATWSSHAASSIEAALTFTVEKANREMKPKCPLVFEMSAMFPYPEFPHPYYCSSPRPPLGRAA